MAERYAESPSSVSEEDSALPEARWKRNLILIWVSQLLSITGFSFALPFFAYAIQDLGVVEKAEKEFWVSLFQGSFAFTMAIFSPLWGMIADRYGRRMMLVRANLGACVILFWMGCVTDVRWLILLRVAQGALTGTISAAQTLVAVGTPERRHGMALGSLSTAVFAGTILGHSLGGITADRIGYAKTFQLSAIFLLIAAILVQWGVEERFKPIKYRWGEGFSPLASIGSAMPLLVLLFATAAVRMFDTPILPLFVQELNGGEREGAATLTGYLNAMGSVGAILGGVAVGYAIDRFSAPLVGKISAVGAALCMVGVGLAKGWLHLFSARFGVMFFAAGLDPAFQVWLIRMTTRERRGAVLGWSVTAKCLGWILSAGCCYAVASRTTHYSMVFLTTALGYLLLLPLIERVSRTIEAEAREQRSPLPTGGSSS